MTRHNKKGHKDVIEEFINMYRDEPCLWRINSKEYRDRRKRREAYKKLTEKLREIIPDADDTATLKKINALRTNYRKEKRKVEESRMKAVDAGDIYQPSLWYYHLFNFLEYPKKTQKFELYSYAPSDSFEETNHFDEDDSTLNELDPDLEATTEAELETDTVLAEERDADPELEPEEERLELQERKRQFHEYDEYDHFAFTIAARIRKIPDELDREILMNSIQNLSFEYLMKRCKRK